MRKITTNHGDYRVTDAGVLEFRPKRQRIFRPYSPDAVVGLVIARNGMAREAGYYADLHEKAKADVESLSLLLAMVQDA